MYCIVKKVKRTMYNCPVRWGVGWWWSVRPLKEMFPIKCSLLHKTLPKSSLQILWISVKFYEMDDSITIILQNTDRGTN